MIVRDDLDRRLTAWFAADAAPREPEHLLGSVLARTARTRRRPAWLIPERWIPMSAITSRAAATPRAPWRLVGALALLILALVVGAMLIVGNQPRELPAPFGPAANGLVAYAADGDIYTVDPVTGQSRAIVTGPETDSEPVWSLDGMQLVFQRVVEGERSGRLYVARADGSNVTAITPEPLSNIDSYSFSPDGREVMIVSDSPVFGKISVAKVDGSGIRTLDIGRPAETPVYRPPDGGEIAFVSGSTYSLGLYVVNADGSNLRTLVEPAANIVLGVPTWSPNGLLIAYDKVRMGVPDWTTQTHIMSADGTGDRTLPLPPDALWSGQGVFSNDGTSLSLVRGYSPRSDEDLVLAVVPTDGSGTGVQTGRGLLAAWPSRYEWAPDDSAILLTPMDRTGTAVQQLLIDPSTGQARPAPWAASSDPTWQRLATD